MTPHIYMPLTQMLDQRVIATILGDDVKIGRGIGKRRTPRAEEVLFVEHLVGDLPICGCGGDSDVKWFADRAVRAYG